MLGARNLNSRVVRRKLTTTHVGRFLDETSDVGSIPTTSTNVMLRAPGDTIMSDGNALIEIGKLAEPAKVLIEKVSDAVGGICKPWQMKRVAKAEVEAAIIKAEGELQITEIEERGLQRLIIQEGKKQQNIEQITAKAIPLLGENSDPNQIEDDWMAHFFSKCDLVSDDEMQSLWAKILAGEATQKGSFKKRSINLVSSLEKEDAHLFTELCGFGFIFGNFTPLVFNPNDEIYNSHNINFSTLNHLDSIGLITFNPISGYARQNLPSEFTIGYFDEVINIKLKPNESKINIGKVLLTDIGQQLSTICGAKKIPNFIDYVKPKFGERVVN